MKLSLADAARLLGKSPRQFRYMIQQGEVKGEKEAGRWVFDDAKLPVSAARAQAQQGKAEELAAAVQEALEPHLRSARGKAYSVADLHAFRAGATGCREAIQTLGGEHPAATSLRASVVALGQGCHRFHHREKAAAFQAAREEAAAAVAHLHIDGRETARALADTLEQTYLSSIVGLLRRQERKEKR